MGELALYRKYRSAAFDDVIGQPHIVSTLKNAVAAGRISHAYLFTGPRGVGKTSVARILARSINCLAVDAPRPCGKCQSCVMQVGNHLDLVEIDAASNRGIDDARSLREKISLAPSLAKYKVYIIDEVHMLTTEAFNALLKTLEEPPAHAVFILATTESHKLPDTIISRTQRFAFRPIITSDIISHLKSIANQENINISDEAIEILAIASKGGFRDALSLLDQVAGSEDQQLSAATVRSLLGWSNQEDLDSLMQAILAGNTAHGLTTLDTILAQGTDATQLVQQLIGLLRRKLRQLLAHPNGDSRALSQLAQALEVLASTGRSPWPSISLEAAIIKLTILPGVALLQPAPPSVSPTAIPAPASPAVSSTPDSSLTNQELWAKAMAQIKQHHHPLHSMLLSPSINIRFESNDVILGCKFSFFLSRLKETKNIQIIEKALTKVYGRKIRALPQMENSQPVVTDIADPAGELVASALEILGGEVVADD